jgi:hypothetical protein
MQLAKKRRSERIASVYFVWRVFRRNKIYWADGRSKKIDAGRHSLGTADHDEAVSRLHQLDAVRAVELKQADESILKSVDKDEITLERGVDLYKKYVARPAVLKGAKESTQSRYKAVFDKAVPYMKGMGLRTWNQIKKHHLESYAAFLQEEEYAYATMFLEVTTLKQLIVSRRLKPASDRRVKTSHFEKGQFRPRSLLAALPRKEAFDAESAQDGEFAVHINVTRARAITT